MTSPITPAEQGNAAAAQAELARQHIAAAQNAARAAEAARLEAERLRGRS